MYQLDNGWYVPDNEKKITSHVISNPNKENPTYEYRVRDKILEALPVFGTFVDVGAATITPLVEFEQLLVIYVLLVVKSPNSCELPVVEIVI